MFIRGRVEYNIDPLKLGRVQIRIPSLHGSEDDIPTESLPWARLISPLGGGYDSGSWAIPEVGSWVLLVKEYGTDISWYYLGVVRGTGIEDRRGSFRSEGDEGYADQIQGAWTKSDEAEYPYESEGLPSKIVPIKSVKGATVAISDEDGNESLDIIGHNGMTMRMISPRISDLKGRASARGSHDMNDPVPTSKFGTIAYLVKDAMGSLFRMMNNRGGKSTLEIVGKDGSKVAGVELLPSDEEARVFVQGGGEVKISSSGVVLSSGSASIKISGGTIDIEGATINIKGSTTSVNGDSLDLKGSSTKLTGSSSVNVTGGSTAKVSAPLVKLGSVVQLGPAVALGVPVVADSAGSPSSPSPEGLGTWSNNVDPKYGGDS